MCVLSIKVPIRKKSGHLFNDPPIYIYSLVEGLIEFKIISLGVVVIGLEVRL